MGRRHQTQSAGIAPPRPPTDAGAYERGYAAGYSGVTETRVGREAAQTEATPFHRAPTARTEDTN